MTPSIRNKADISGVSSEEMELIEVTTEALTQIVRHPNAHKYVNHMMKLTAYMLQKFVKILDAERNNPDINTVICNNNVIGS